MVESRRPPEPIPDHFSSIEAAADFWDIHDMADYSELTTEAEFAVDLQRRRYLVALDPALAERLAAEAHRRGLSSETLVNLRLSECLSMASARY